MGSWGVGIFSNDAAADIREDFRDLIAEGLSADEATGRLHDDYGIGPGGVDDNDFWLGLAAAQHRIGHVADGVLDRALEIIGDPAELERWDPKDRTRRRAALAKLHAQLEAPVPAAKKVRPRKRVDTSLAAGDHVLFDVGSRVVLLRITGISSDKGGRYPTAIEVDWDGSERQLKKAHRLKPVVESRNTLRRGPEARGFTLIGEPADPPDLQKLQLATDRRTPTMRWQSAWVLRWSQLAGFLTEDQNLSK
ncbi:MAG: hypothetical protein KAG80_02680 [Nocardioides sp.]|nr:hypothetical protein [Nocardioides sp.]